MLEPLRSQYLAALGIDSYVPRFMLPGAKLSEPCAWLEAPAEIPNLSVPIEANAAAGQPLVEKNIPEKSASAVVSRTPLIEPVVQRPARISENVSAKSPTAQHEAGPQFALSIVLAGGGILLIDAAPASSAERSAFQKLLNNMLPALRPAAVHYVLDIFIWPLTRQSKVPRDAEAAIETLAAHLSRQIGQRGIDTVLLLGETAQRWCAFLENELRTVKSSSLLACVQDPALKRPLWNDIRHLADT